MHSDKHLMIKTPTEETHTIQFSLVSNSWVSNEEFERFHDLRAKHRLEQISKRDVCLPLDLHYSFFFSPLLLHCVFSVNTMLLRTVQLSSLSCSRQVVWHLCVM